jgi:Fe-S-cluster containining protein
MTKRKSVTRKKKKISKLLAVQCSQCSTCCRVPVALATHHDINRLVKATGLEAGKIVSLYANVDADDDDRFLIRTSYGKRTMGLRKVKGRCMFLSDNQSCSVYNFRPMSCRMFPLQVTLEDDNSLHDLNVQDSAHDDFSCRYRFGRSRSLKDIHRIAVSDFLEQDSYLKKVEEWNARSQKGKKQELLEFLGCNGSP